MRIPYVIDNETHRLADVLNEVLAGHAGRSLDVATAYFTVTESEATPYSGERKPIRREDLRLICFEFLSAG